MTKTIRPHQVQEAAEQLYGSKLKKLIARVDFLTQRLNQLERRMGSINPQPADFTEVDDVKSAILIEKGLPDASGSERKENSGEENG